MTAGSTAIHSLHKTFSTTVTEAARWRARLLHQSQVAGTVWLQSNGKEFENVEELNSLKPAVI